MIDLSAQNKVKDLYKIKLEDGSILKLRKPTQSMLIEMINMSQGDNDGVELISELYRLITRVFNRNVDEKEFTIEQLEEMVDVNMAMAIIQDYLNETMKIVGK